MTHWTLASGSKALPLTVGPRVRLSTYGLPVFVVMCLLLPSGATALMDFPGETHGPPEPIRTDDFGTLLQRTEGVRPAYLPDEIVVKFRPDASRRFREKLNENLRLAGPADPGVPSIGELNRKHGAKQVEPVFGGLHRALGQRKTIRDHHAEVGTRYPRRSQRAVAKEHLPDLSAFYRIRFSARAAGELASIVAQYRDDPNVEHAELVPIYKVQLVPNDPYFSSSGSWGQPYADMWGLTKLVIEPAWDLALAGSRNTVVVAVVDTGADYEHPDLAANMWVSPAEIPGNGVDDDGNGYIDDHHGFNFVARTGDPRDDHGHGSHLAGTIAAVTNNGIGIAGIALDARIMALKGLDKHGEGNAADLAEAIQYAADNGADVQNFSWGGLGTPRVLLDAVKYAHALGCVLVAAAGNERSDASYFSPASMKEVITVSSTDQNDVKSVFSNYGAKIDVAAPGGGSGSGGPPFPDINVLSLLAAGTDMYCPWNPSDCGVMIVGRQYFRARGTSMAAPHVSGVAALVLSTRPELNNEQLRQVLRLGSDDLSYVENDCAYASFGMCVTDQQCYWRDPQGSYCMACYFPDNGECCQAMPGCSWDDTYLRCWSQAGQCIATIPSYGQGRDPQTGYGRINAYRSLQQGTPCTVWIASPHPHAFLHGTIDIRGTASGGNFQSFRVEFGAGEDPVSYTPVCESAAFVEDGLLCSWDTSTVPIGNYTVRLVVTDTVGLAYEDRVLVRVDPVLRDGWLFDTGYFAEVFTNPSFADIDHDGFKEVVAPTVSGSLYVLRHDGTLMPGWPVWLGVANDRFSPPAIGDIDHNGRLEIFLSTRGGVHALDHTGSQLPGWPKEQDKNFVAPIVLADLDWNGDLEIIGLTKGAPAFLYVWAHNGSLRPGFPVNLGNQQASSNLSAADIDPTKIGSEIVVPTSNGDYDTTIKVFSSSGALLSSYTFPQQYGRSVNVSIGDIDGDGPREIVYATWAGEVGILDGHARLLRQWSAGAELATGTEPVLCNLDGDPQLEIVASEYLKRRIFAWKADGTPLPGWPRAADFPIHSPTAADVDGDQVTDLLALRHMNVHYENGVEGYRSDATPLPGWPIDLYRWPSAMYMSLNFQHVSVDDIDGDGKLDLAAAPESGLLYVIELPNSGVTGSMDWPTALHDNRRTSTYGECGNGILEDGERCDDENRVNGDGCDANCTLTGCGNWIVTAGEQCDDGNADDADCCSSDCRLVQLDGTACDDGIFCNGVDTCDAGVCAVHSGDPCVVVACAPRCDETGQSCGSDSAACLIPGSGRAATNCMMEWWTPEEPTRGRGAMPRNQLWCHDGEPSCDFGPAGDRSCTFHVALCLNVTDSRLGCTPTDVREVRLLQPGIAAQQTDGLNRDALEGLLQGIGGTTAQGVCADHRTPPRSCSVNADCDSAPAAGDGRCRGMVEFEPPLSARRCTQFADIRVPSRANGRLPGHKSLRLMARSSDSRRFDTDKLTLVCRP